LTFRRVASSANIGIGRLIVIRRQLIEPANQRVKHFHFDAAHRRIRADEDQNAAWHGIAALNETLRAALG
jgi:hypothetical protein